MHPQVQQIDPPADGTNRYDLARRQFRHGLALVLRSRHLHRSQFRILHCLLEPALRSACRRNQPTTLSRVRGRYTGVLPNRHPVPGWFRTLFIVAAAASSRLSSLSWWQCCVPTSSFTSPLPGTPRASCTVQIQSHGRAFTGNHSACTPSHKIFDANPGCGAKILPRIM